MAASNAADGIRFATDPSLLPKINPPKEDPHLKGLDLRQYTDFSINNEDLHDTWRPPYNRRLKEDSPGHHSKTLYDAWKRVQIPYLESNDFGDSFEAMSSDTRNAYEQQHNALCELRHNFQSHGELFVYPRSDDSNEGPDISHDEGTATPSKEAIHHFAYRIISQVQQQEKAVLGNFDGGKWWIAPPNASIELTSVETSNPTPDKAQPDGEGDGLTRLRESDRARAVAADYTVHWVCYQHKQKGTENSHLAVIIRERATGNTWYFDSLDPRKVDTEVDLDEKYQSVVSRLHKLCRKNDIEIPANTFHRRVGVIPQDRPWACGLHAIAHTLAFLRFGVLGWHEISTWAKPAGDEAKLRKLRHDMMRAMELSMGLRPTPRVDAEGIPFPEHYDDQLDLSRFRFPTYPSVGVEKKDLHNCEEPPFTDELEPSQEDILREKYGRVHIECYDGISLQGKGVDPFSYKVYAELHNGLRTLRNDDWLSGEQVHYYATRLMTKVQEQAGADLGPARAENQDWWIAPEEYFIRCQKNKTTGETEDQLEWINALSVVGPEHETYRLMGEVGDSSKDKDKFDRAKYTIHWVHHSYHGDHWGVIVREKATNFAWYFDSMKSDREDRKNSAIVVFNKWLVKCDATTVSESFLVPALGQSSGWECGLHAIAHAVAFIRFGVLGWDALPLEAIAVDEGRKENGGQTTAPAPLNSSKRLRETMTSALHGLMGVALPSPTSKDDGNGTSEAVEDSNGNTNSNSADKTNAGSSGNSKSGPSGKSNPGLSGTKPSDAMGTSSQPPGKNPAGLDRIPRKDEKEHAVPHPTFYNAVRYEQQGLGFRFPTYPSLPLAAYEVKSVREPPYDKLITNDVAALYPAYKRVDFRCCDNLELRDQSQYAEGAYKEIHNALVDMRSSTYLEDQGMYHLACRFITYVQDQPGARLLLGPWGLRQWWIAPMAFLIDVPGPEGEDVQEPQTFSDLVSDIWGTSSIYGDASSYEQNFDRALYTVHFIHHRDPDHWTVIVRESETGHLWHFDSGGGEDERERRLNGAIDRLTTWLRRCNKQIPETSEAFNVSVTEQTQHWECSLHSIANAMAFLRFGILGWDKLKCIALETDADPVPPARSVNADKLRTTMKRSLHGLWGLMMKEDVASVNEQVEQAERENDPEYLKALGDESQMIRQEKAMNELKEIVFKPQTQDSLKELERKARENREEKRKEKEAREAREKEEEEKKKAQEQRDKEAEEELVELAKQMEDELKATQDDSLIDKANMSFDKVIDAVTNNPDELNSLNEQERKAREAREKKRKEQLEKDQREIKERFRRAQAERERRAQARKAREEREKEEEKERERKAQEARDKEQQEKLNQQQGASNSRKRGAADDDDDDDESSGRSSKRSKQTPEENPTENLPQSPNNKRKTPPPDTEPKPAKRARREPTPAPKAPVRQSERQRKATQKAAEAVQETEAAQGAEAAQEAEAAEESEDAVVEPDWREARRARLRAMGMTRLIEECKRRLLAGPGDEHKPLPYSAYKTIDGLVERLMWYDEPEGYEEDLEGKSLKELKEMCKETYKLYYGGTKVGLMKERLRWFYAEQQRHVQTLIEDGEIPANWNGEEVVEEEEDLFGDDEVENGEEEEEDEDISEEP